MRKVRNSPIKIGHLLFKSGGRHLQVLSAYPFTNGITKCNLFAETSTTLLVNAPRTFTGGVFVSHLRAQGAALADLAGGGGGIGAPLPLALE